MYEDLFNKYYLKLTKDQKEAVDTIEGPLMVIAGPGTGKTQILAMRILNILRKTQVNPSNILALTFTDSGVIAMKKRLAEIIGPQGYYVNVYTFHSFCNDVIQSFPEKFIFSRELKPLSDLEQIKIFENLLNSLPLKKLKSFYKTNFYLYAIKKNIQILKREGISVSQFYEKIKEEEDLLQTIEKISKRTNKISRKYTDKENLILKNKDLALIYENYQKKLQETGQYDYDDMILFVLKKFKEDEELLSYYQEKYQYIHVDEFQDSNSAQNEVVSLLTSFFNEPNIFVVGDDDQCIFRFQGACLENLLSFNKRYPNFKKVVIDENFRSTQLILDSAQNMINNNVIRIGNYLDVKKLLISKTGFENKKISYYEFLNEDYENYFVAEKIKELHDQKGVPYSEIAVLYKNNADSDLLSETLIKSSIPFNNFSGCDILKDIYINRFLDLLKAITNPSDNLNFYRILNFEIFKISAYDLFKLSKLRFDKRSNFVDLVLDIKLLKEKQKEDFFNSIIPFNNFAELFLSWSKEKENSTLFKFIGQVFRDSGLLNYFSLMPDSIRILQKFKTLFKYAKEVNNFKHDITLKEFLETIDSLREHNLQLIEEELMSNRDAVSLMTVHKAKGLEFSYVFILRCYDKNFGNKRNSELIKLPESIVQHLNISKKEKNEDERRLFYVALTRAKKEVFLSYATKYGTSYGTQKKVTPSQFILEMGKNNILECDTQEIETSNSKIVNLFFEAPKPETYADNEKSYLENLIEKYVMNVTALDTYLECPKKFEYNNLLRLPRAKSLILGFGSAIHFALQFFFLRFKEQGKLPQKEELAELFENGLKKEILTEKEFIDLKNKGIEVLNGYYSYYKDSFQKPVYTEFNFVKNRIYLDGIPITGKIDKIEMIDPIKKEVKVIDYKTGRAKSRNEIEGKTKSSKKSYKKQLIFYKLLGDLDKFFPYTIRYCEFDYVEPSYNKFKKECFEITQEDVNLLKSEIKEVYAKIKKLEFPKTTDKSVCKKCDFYKICWG